MPRAYLRTADPQPTPTEKRRRKLAKARSEMIAEYERRKQAHGQRAVLARDLVKLTTTLLATEIKPHKTAERPAPPVADLFSR